MVPQRQISRPARETIGENVRTAGKGKFDLRCELKIPFEECLLVLGINAKSFKSSYRDVRRPEDNNFLKRNGIENGSNVEIYSGMPFR